MGSSAQQSTGTIGKSDSSTVKVYKPLHGEIARARAHVVQRSKNELLTRLEATGSVDRAKFEAEFGPVTQKHLDCINGHIQSASPRLHFEVVATARMVYCRETLDAKPKS